MFILIRRHAASRQLIFSDGRFQLDFEPATLKAIEEVFPQAEVKGCNFHFVQCLWRKVQGLGLQRAYNQPGIKKTVRSIAALAFVPENHIAAAWRAIEDESSRTGNEDSVELEVFKQYFVANWLENATLLP